MFDVLKITYRFKDSDTHHFATIFGHDNKGGLIVRQIKEVLGQCETTFPVMSVVIINL